jgi:hypothetical protein
VVTQQVRDKLAAVICITVKGWTITTLSVVKSTIILQAACPPPPKGGSLNVHLLLQMRVSGLWALLGGDGNEAVAQITGLTVPITYFAERLLPTTVCIYIYVFGQPVQEFTDAMTALQQANAGQWQGSWAVRQICEDQLPLQVNFVCSNEHF